MPNRLYIVTNKATGEVMIVEASSQAQAVHIVSATLLEVHVARAIEVGELMRSGTTIISKSVTPDETK